MFVVVRCYCPDIEMDYVRLYTLIFLKIVMCVQAQVTFVPDPAETVALNVTVLAPVEVITVEQYHSAPIINVHYVTVDGSEAVYDVYNRQGSPLNFSSTRPIQFRGSLDILRFVVEPVLVGGTFRLRATLDNNIGNSTLSNRRYTFPTPFNLTGSSASAVFNSSFTWTCHVTSDFPIIQWVKDKTNPGQVGVITNGSCVTYDQDDSYIYNCQRSNLTYTLTIPGTSMTKELQSSKWRCKDVYSEVKGSKFIELDIIVPVTTVTISPGSESTVAADENQTVTFTCLTNDANPPPTILWLFVSSDATIQAGLNVTELTFNLKSFYNRMQINCTAWNSGNVANQSDSITLNVRFPPASNEELQIVGYTSGQVLYENNPATIGLYCRQPGGNPVANMSFNCGSQTGTIGDTTTDAIRRVNLTNDRNLNGQKCICASAHINGYLRSINMSFIVYYPPSTPTTSPDSQFPWKAPGTYNLTCNTIPGNPENTTFVWHADGAEQINLKEYKFNPLQPSDNNRQLYCQVNNDFTLHENVKLISNITTLHVEFDPIVTLNESSVAVIEGHTAVLRCSATGNPAPKVTWYRDSKAVTGSTVSSSNYSIVNISRTATGDYTCKANSSSTGINMLQPDQKSSYLTVFYPPNVSLLLENTTENIENHVIRCSAKGVPNNASIVVLQQKIGSTLIRNISSFTESSLGNITLTIDKVSYQDMGTYTCLASNGIPDRSNHMVQSDTAYFNVTISAKFEMMQYTMQSDIDKPAAISIPFYRNPPATDSDVVWTKKTATSNGTVVSSANVSLSLNDTDVQQTLHGVDVALKGQSAIMKITSFQNYYEGNYTLKIRSNHADSAEVTVTLIRSGPPDTPSDFQLLSSKLTSVVLTWKKGSDGGHQQAFVILYREKTAEVYDFKQIVDTTVNVTITDEIEHLKSDTSYELILYSFNEKGNSTGNQALKERTLKAPVTSTPESLNSGLVGGAVGGGAAVVVAVIVIIFVMRRKQERDNETHLYQNQNRSFYTDLQFDRPTTNDEEERAAYTMLQFGQQHTYSNMDNVHGAEGGQ